MAVTQFTKDYLGRDLVTPTVDARDYIGRAATGVADYIGRGLTVAPAAPSWTATTAYGLNARVTLSGGAVLVATVAGTSAAAPPAPPAVGSTVVDGTVTWKRLA